MYPIKLLDQGICEAKQSISAIRWRTHSMGLVFLVIVSYMVVLHVITAKYNTIPKLNFHIQMKQRKNYLIPKDEVKKSATYSDHCSTHNFSVYHATYPSLSVPFLPDKYNQDQIRVINATKWAWKAYRENAFGSDILYVEPTLHGESWQDHDLGITLIDSLDTLYVMGLKEEFQEGIQWVKEVLPSKINVSKLVSMFETTIRITGGLLSAYYFSGDPIVLEIAEKYALSASQAFQTPTGLPKSKLNLQNGFTAGSIVLSEIGTVQLEYSYLAELTCNSTYAKQVDDIMVKLINESRARYPDGLLPIHFSDTDGTALPNSPISWGSGGDSYYEYLLKMWLYSRKTDTKYKVAYEIAVQGLRDRLVRSSLPNNITFISTMQYGMLDNKMEHLVCFVPGLLALGFYHGMPKWHLELAKELMYTCYLMYKNMGSGLSPELVKFYTEQKYNSDRDFTGLADWTDVNIGRPETVESLMILYRVTKNNKYRVWGREIFDAFETHSRLPNGGYSPLQYVGNKFPQLGKGHMESFFIAETLKYFFLLFSDSNVISLDEFVFNTEAHPFPIPKQ